MSSVRTGQGTVLVARRQWNMANSRATLSRQLLAAQSRHSGCQLRHAGSLAPRSSRKGGLGRRTTYNPEKWALSVRNRIPVASKVPVCLNGLRYQAVRAGVSEEAEGQDTGAEVSGAGVGYAKNRRYG